ncbi:MAG: sensor histidine kinase [Steroidobacteraceae bacterium]
MGNEGPQSTQRRNPRTNSAQLFAPLNIAAYVTWLGVSAKVLDWPAMQAGQARAWFGFLALIGMLVLFVVHSLPRRTSQTTRGRLNVLLQGALVLLADYLLRGGDTAVLLIVVAAQLVSVMPLASAIGFVCLFDAFLILHWWSLTGDLVDALLDFVPLFAFEGFAAVTGYYMMVSERRREHLEHVNAELLATQRLLEESARSGERLKLSRELHDVAGHKLTALKLILTRLARRVDAEVRDDMELGASLADELLADIRGVVSALRQHDGLALGETLKALARPVAGTHIAVDVEPDLRVDSVAQAETILRCAQEAITNALRHGRASEIRLLCRRDDDGLLLEVTNNGATPSRITFGNGLTGMRERLAALGGRLSVDTDAAGGVRLRAWLTA